MLRDHENVYTIRERREEKKHMGEEKTTDGEGSKSFTLTLHFPNRDMCFSFGSYYCLCCCAQPQRHLVAATQMFNNNMKSTFGLTAFSFPSLRNPAPVSKGCLLVKRRATGNFPTKTLKLFVFSLTKTPTQQVSLFFFRAVA